jgi:trehalose 6-phosphate synthase/phosphatase
VDLAAAYQGAARRLFFLDYDGTLVPLAPRPAQAVPTDDVRRLLARLAADPRNAVVIVSGRDKDTLDRWFGGDPLTLVAEHGTWIKALGAPWRMAQPLSDAWKAQIRPVLERSTHRLPGALLEEKTVALAWHYRQADPELGPVRAKELLDHLMAITGNLDLRVLQGHKVIEVRPSSISKALVAQTWVAADPAAWMLAIGDDWTDEDLFGALPEAAYTIKVGPGASAARFRMDSYRAVLRLLDSLARRETVGGPGAAERAR